MVMMFISNITLANLYIQSSTSDNSKETTFSTKKHETSFWLRFANAFVSELEETEEKNEKEAEEVIKTISFQLIPFVYYSFELQNHLFTAKINEWLQNQAPQLKSKISSGITLSLHRFRL